MLEQSLKHRKLVYDQITRDILNNYKNILNKSLFLYARQERKIEWYDIFVIPFLPNHVEVQGLLITEIGDTIFVENDKTIKIDESNYFEYKDNSSVFRTVIPIKALEESDCLTICKSMKAYDDVMKLLSFGEIVDIILKYNVTSFIEFFENPIILEKITRPKQLAGFDTGNLSEEQFNKLKLFQQIDLNNSKN